MNSTNPAAGSRLEREVERERDERHKNDDAKSGGNSEQEFRNKDARDSTSSSNLNRTRR